MFINFLIPTPHLLKQLLLLLLKHLTLNLLLLLSLLLLLFHPQLILRLKLRQLLLVLHQLIILNHISPFLNLLQKAQHLAIPPLWII